MKRLVWFICPWLLTGCVLSSDPSPVEPAVPVVQLPSYAPVSVLMSWYLAACEKQSFQQNDNYLHELYLHDFFNRYCQAKSSASRLTALKRVQKQAPWPESYQHFFSLLKRENQHTQKLAGALHVQKKAVKRLTAELNEVATQLDTLKAQLAQLQRKRLEQSLQPLNDEE
ncbi:MAG: hypothetical protein AAGJ33_05565 [Pseudomonadota bacterium]